MQKPKLTLWKNLLEKFNYQTPICKICLKENSKIDFSKLIINSPYLCQKCLQNFAPLFIHFAIMDIKCLAIYRYDEYIKNLLYQFKGCYDYELKDVFIKRFAFELRLTFWNYIIVPVPSSKLADERRQFNHVIEMFSCLKLKITRAIEKIDDYKQSEETKTTRCDISKHIQLSENKINFNQNILLVDDVFTTGNTIKACINLLKIYRPKKIKVLVMSKVINNML